MLDFSISNGHAAGGVGVGPQRDFYLSRVLAHFGPGKTNVLVLSHALPLVWRCEKHRWKPMPTWLRCVDYKSFSHPYAHCIMR